MVSQIKKIVNLAAKTSKKHSHISFSVCDAVLHKIKKQCTLFQSYTISFYFQRHTPHPDILFL
jgi:hypothetical protein